MSAPEEKLIDIDQVKPVSPGRKRVSVRLPSGAEKDISQTEVNPVADEKKRVSATKRRSSAAKLRREEVKEQKSLEDVTARLEKLGFSVKGSVTDGDKLTFIETTTLSGKRVIIDVTNTPLADSTRISASQKQIGSSASIGAFQATCIDRKCKVVLPCKDGVCLLNPVGQTVERTNLSYDRVRTGSFTSEPSQIPVPVITLEQVEADPRSAMAFVDNIGPVLRTSVLRSKSIILSKVESEVGSLLPDIVKRAGGWGEQLFRLVHADLMGRAAECSRITISVYKNIFTAFATLDRVIAFEQTNLGEIRLQLNPELLYQVRGHVPRLTPEQLQDLERKQIADLEMKNKEYDVLLAEIDKLDQVRQTVSPIIKDLGDQTVTVSNILQNPLVVRDQGYASLVEYVAVLGRSRDGIMSVMTMLDQDNKEILAKIFEWQNFMKPYEPISVMPQMMPQGQAPPAPAPEQGGPTPEQAQVPQGAQ
jgi:hypothetical protein